MPDYKCPCGASWPCLCSQGRKVLGLRPKPIHPEDEYVVALARCPGCGEDALVEIDPGDVVEWLVETLTVLEVGPAMGSCCRYLFAMQPDGHVIVMEDKED